MVHTRTNYSLIRQHLIFLPILFFSIAAPAQEATPPQTSSSPQSAQLPDAPQYKPASPITYPAAHKYPYDEGYLIHVGALCGVGASKSSVAIVPTTGCGVGMTLVPLPVFLEIGVMAPQANRSPVTGYISVDGSIPLAPSSGRYLPMAIVGYSRLFETGHALDYGLALAMPSLSRRKNDGTSLRLELRDYWTFASPNQHNIMLRLGWMSIETD